MEIKTISFGGVNCYLITTATGFVLIDTGYAKHRADVEKELENAGCMPEALKLILLTHGDSTTAATLRICAESTGQKSPCTAPIKEWWKKATSSTTETPIS
jgi:glyoxylase-like metal-dependent hydrolase (beta-lactamase superfamily II)